MNKLKKNDKDSSAVLTQGQLWKTDNAYIQIWNVGKRLIDYKMVKQPGQRAVPTQATRIDTLQEYLKTQKAMLVSDPPALITP